MSDPPAPVAEDTHREQRLRNVVIAGHRGDVSTATAHLSDSAAMIRAASLSALDRMEALTADMLESAAHDPAVAVRRRAAELSIEVPAQTVETLLADPDASVVEVTCFVVGEIDWSTRTESAPIGALVTIAETHDDALCRESAAAALGALGDPAGLDAVLHACADRVTVRRRAVLALAAFDDPRVDEALRHALDDKDWQVRQAAEDLLEVGRKFDATQN